MFSRTSRLLNFYKDIFRKLKSEVNFLNEEIIKLHQTNRNYDEKILELTR